MITAVVQARKDCVRHLSLFRLCVRVRPHLSIANIRLFILRMKVVGGSFNLVQADSSLQLLEVSIDELKQMIFELVAVFFQSDC